MLLTKHPLNTYIILSAVHLSLYPFWGSCSSNAVPNAMVRENPTIPKPYKRVNFTATMAMCREMLTV